MNEKPSVLIVSSSQTKPKSLIRLITGTVFIDDDKNDHDIVTYPWKIQTKYYTAEVNIHGITETYVRTDTFNERVEALIIHIDTNKESGLDDIKKWESLEYDCEPDVKLLITNYCNSDTKVSKARAIEWCLKRGYELVELYPANSIKAQNIDEIIEEKTGVDRIVEALQTHVWSNLIMKEEETAKSDIKLNTGSFNSTSIEEMLTAEGTDDFTELFSQLHMMKESVQSMPMRERKQCAEQIATAFWKAIGGDEEEIADL